MMTSFEQLNERTRRFGEARGWPAFHTPKNLAMALSVEASELVEIFQWLTPEQFDQLDSETRNHAAEEIADIQIYLLQIAARLRIDIGAAVEAKMEKNALKYPVT